MSEDSQQSLDQAERLARAIDDAIMHVEPTVSDLQVAASPTGVVIISGVVASPEAAIRAGEAAQKISGVQRLINNLTIIA